MAVSYPTWVYCDGNPSQLVQNAGQVAALPPGFSTTPFAVNAVDGPITTTTTQGTTLPSGLVHPNVSHQTVRIRNASHIGNVRGAPDLPTKSVTP